MGYVPIARPPRSGPQPPEPREPVPPRPPGRSGRSARDMVISLIVLLIPIAFVVAVFRLRGGEDVVVVDPSSAIAQAQASASFPVAAPVGLPPGWLPVSARFSRGDAGAVLRVGYLTPAGGAVQLVESDEPFDDLTARELGDPAGSAATVVIDGVRWQSLAVRTDERALVATSPERTMIVVGRASAVELAELAAAVS